MNNILEGTITITKKEYFSLKLDAENLERLENGGVDNWEWYGESLNPDDELDIDDFEDKLREEIAKLK